MQLAGWWMVLAAFGCQGSGNSIGVDADDAPLIDAQLDGPAADSSPGWVETAVTASNNGGNFSHLALSGDGTTLVVGATGESSAATTINGDQSDMSAPFTGAAYVFVRSGTAWIQQAYIKAFNGTSMNDFGWNVAISHDGNTIAVGAPFEPSGGYSSGAVYVYRRTAGTWAHQAFLKASNVEANDAFGQALALSADGTTIVVGAQQDDSASSTINSGESDNSSLQAGAAYVFALSGGVWAQQAYLKPSNMRTFALFGSAVDVSPNGNTVVVTSQYESSDATGVGGNQASTNAFGSGAAYVFERSGTTWTQGAYIKASNTASQARFGHSVALSADVSTMVVGASQENGASIGINGDQSAQTASYSGAAYVFVKSAGTWSQQAYLKASNTQAGDYFAEAVAISASGGRIIVGAGAEDSDATGLNGNQQSNLADSSGAAYVFQRSSTTWSQLLYVKATDTAERSSFGSSVGHRDVAMTADGSIFAAGAAGAGQGRGGVYVVQ